VFPEENLRLVFDSVCNVSVFLMYFKYIAETQVTSGFKYMN